MNESEIRCRERARLTWYGRAAVFHVGSSSRSSSSACSGQAGKVVWTVSSVSMADNEEKAGCALRRPVEVSC